MADGVFFAELNEVLTRELAEDGYSGVEVRVTPMRTEIIIRATRTQNVLGKRFFSRRVDILPANFRNMIGKIECVFVSYQATAYGCLSVFFPPFFLPISIT